MEPGALTPWLLVVKLGLYASSLLAIGIGLQVALEVVPAFERSAKLRAASAAAIVAIACALARLLITNSELGGGLSEAFDSASFGWTWRMQGPATLALIAGALAILFAQARRSRILASAAATLLAVSFALTGHGQAVSDPFLTPIIVAVHVAIGGFWFVAPFTLWPQMSVSNEELRRRLDRFSAVAVVAVPLLFGLGAWLAWRLAGGLSPLLTSLYGQILIAKLVAAAVALGLGALNKQMIARPVITEPARGRRMLAGSLALDVALFCTVLLLVGWATTMTGPPDL